MKTPYPAVHSTVHRRCLAALLFTSSLGVVFLPAGCDKTNPDDFRDPFEKLDASVDADAGPLGPEEVTFPSGFLWGSSTSAFQTEKGNTGSDWAKWVTTPGKVRRGETPDGPGGADSLNHIDDDVRALEETGQNAYRFSIEWTRVFPSVAALEANSPDPAAIAAYDKLISSLRAAGITPVATLMHYSLPVELSDPSKPNEPQGWERADTPRLFALFCQRMAERYKDKVDHWLTMNEPLVLLFEGYLAGTYPPGVQPPSAERGFAVIKSQARAHALAYDAIRTADTVAFSEIDAGTDAGSDAGGKPGAQVSLAAHQAAFLPQDPNSAEDVEATKRINYLWNQWFYNAIVRGDWDDDFDGTYDGPNDRRADPALKGRADFIGVNYYSDALVTTKGPTIPGIGAAVLADHLPTPYPKTDFAWDIFPEGLRRVLLQAKDYGLPIIITENGLADAQDKNRARFLTEHIYQAGWARQEGVDLRGYLHWSLVDNFEWQFGFCPKFGLYAVDPQTAARTARASATTYKNIISAAKVRRSDVAAQPAYTSQTTFCE